MENINKPQGLAKISEVPGAIKEIEHENSSEDVSSLNEKNNSKNSKQEKTINSQISKKLDDLNKKLDLKQSEDET